MTMTPGEWRGTCTINTDGRPVIKVGSDEVPERMRLAAAINMRLDPARRDRVVEMIGEAEARRRYPEAWWTGEQIAVAEAEAERAN